MSNPRGGVNPYKKNASGEKEGEGNPWRINTEQFRALAGFEKRIAKRVLEKDQRQASEGEIE